MFPSIWPQMGSLNLQNIKKIAEEMRENIENKSASQNNEDDDVPTLVENFDEQSKLQ